VFFPFFLSHNFIESIFLLPNKKCPENVLEIVRGRGEGEKRRWGEEGKIEGLKVRKFEGLRGLISRMRFF
jgi:hypothetical protein